VNYRSGLWESLGRSDICSQEIGLTGMREDGIGRRPLEEELFKLESVAVDEPHDERLQALSRREVGKVIGIPWVV
jgi:hypothetical protein